MRKIERKMLNPWWLKNKVTSLILDYKYTGCFLGRVIPSRFANVGAREVSGTDYSLLPVIFKSLSLSVSNVFVDVGCGKGRVIAWWLSQGFKNKIYGIELDPEVGKGTRERFKQYKNAHVLIGDACRHIPPDANIFFLFNPFNSLVMERFSSRLIEMFDGQKNIKIFYYNPKELDVFERNPKWLVEVFDVDNCRELRAVAKCFVDSIKFAVISLNAGF